MSFAGRSENKKGWRLRVNPASCPRAARTLRRWLSFSWWAQRA